MARNTVVRHVRGKCEDAPKNLSAPRDSLVNNRGMTTSTFDCLAYRLGIRRTRPVYPYHYGNRGQNTYNAERLSDGVPA